MKVLYSCSKLCAFTYDCVIIQSSLLQNRTEIYRVLSFYVGLERYRRRPGWLGTPCITIYSIGFTKLRKLQPNDYYQTKRPNCGIVIKQSNRTVTRTSSNIGCYEMLYYKNFMNRQSFHHMFVNNHTGCFCQVKLKSTKL